MDADTRHQLRQNELAEALAKLKDFGDRRTVAWTALILAIALGYVGYKFWRWRQHNQVVAAYQALGGVDPTDASLGDAPLTRLRELIAGNSQPGLVALSRLRLAQGLEARGQIAGGSEKLAEAEAEYHAVLNMPEAPNHFKASAMYRLGMLHETRRDFDQARATYASLSQDQRLAGSPFVELAAQRLDQLDELARPIVFKPGVKPLPTTQPITEAMSHPATQPAGPPRFPTVTAPRAARPQPADPEASGEPTADESSKPQQP
jgi:predicted negative regulator of RcsB-dependent stress response